MYEITRNVLAEVKKAIVGKDDVISKVWIALLAEGHVLLEDVPGVGKTTMAALLGALPLMIGWGMGAELRRPLGVTMVGGLIVSQVLTLFTTPVIYIWFARLAEKLGRRGGEAGHEQA